MSYFLPQDVIGEALSTLSKLRTLCAYLDLPHQPTILYYGPFHYNSVDIREYTKTLCRVACALAGTIPSLEMVYLWRPRDMGEIEYDAEETELDLLRSLATMFPQLFWLQLHRYGRVRADGRDVRSVRITDQFLHLIHCNSRMLSGDYSR